MVLAGGMLLPARDGTAAPAATVSWPAVDFRLVSGGFSQPLLVTHDGTPGLLYVVEQGGLIWRVGTTGTREPQPWLNLAGQVNGCYECGLLSVAFPPGYTPGGAFYTNHTRGRNGAAPPTADSPMESVITRWRTFASGPQAGLVDPGSREEILIITQPFEMHNGGHMLFGPDGMLWIGMGDGGDEGLGPGRVWDPLNNSQSRNPDPLNMRLLGKILRINVSTPTGYAVPGDNPTFDAIRDEVWAFGVRNPWRIWIDPVTNMLYIADVGNLDQEEVNLVPAVTPPGGVGYNFQWSCKEGLRDVGEEGACFASGPGPGVQAGPYFTYDRNLGDSITGGVVYRGPRAGALTGVYLFGDFQSGRLWGTKQNGGSWETTILRDRTDMTISSFGTDALGNAYIVDYQFGGQGRVFEVVEQGCLPGDVCRYLPAVFKVLAGGW